MIPFYEAPIPGFGSRSDLITDQAFYFQSVLDARSFDNLYRNFFCRRVVRSLHAA